MMNFRYHAKHGNRSIRGDINATNSVRALKVAKLELAGKIERRGAFVSLRLLDEDGGLAASSSFSDLAEF